MEKDIFEEMDIIEKTSSYSVDIILVIDATKEMREIMEQTKILANNFYYELMNRMEANGHSVQCLRIKVITFRNFAYDDDDAITESAYFSIPEEESALFDCINSIEAKGGNGAPPNALEALGLVELSRNVQSENTQNHG